MKLAMELRWWPTSTARECWNEQRPAPPCGTTRASATPPPPLTTMAARQEQQQKRAPEIEGWPNMTLFAEIFSFGLLVAHSDGQSAALLLPTYRMCQFRPRGTNNLLQTTNKRPKNLALPLASTRAVAPGWKVIKESKVIKFCLRIVYIKELCWCLGGADQSAWWCDYTLLFHR
jgi:hypothetical protein